MRRVTHFHKNIQQQPRDGRVFGIEPRIVQVRTFTEQGSESSASNCSGRRRRDRK